jgi:hypothetical protein
MLVDSADFIAGGLRRELLSWNQKGAGLKTVLGQIMTLHLKKAHNYSVYIKLWNRGFSPCINMADCRG